MLADQRWPPINAPWRGVQTKGRARITESAAEFRMFDVDEIAARLELLVAGQFVDRADGGIRQPQGLGALGQLIAVLVFHPFVQNLVKPFAICPAVAVVAPLRFGQFLRFAVAAGPFQKRVPVAGDRVHYIPVAASRDPEATKPMHRAITARYIVLAEVTPRQMLDRRRCRLLETDVDPLARPTAVAGEQGTHNRDHRVMAAGMVRLQTQGPDRPLLRISAYVKHPAQSRQDRIVGLIIAPRPGLTEGRDRAENQRRVDLTQSIPSQA